MRRRARSLLPIFIVWVGSANAHQAPSGMAYDQWCCDGDGTKGDCAPIPSSSVTMNKNGYRIVLRPGDHPRVHVTHVWEKTFMATRTSTDGRYHACLFPSEYQLRCFYAPPVGS